MSMSRSAMQCADPNCSQPSEPTAASHCQKCQRSVHATCGIPGEENGDENARICSQCAPAVQPATQSGRKSKRRRLNLAEKLRALDMVENGAALQDVADEFGSSKRAILRMRQEADVIRGLSQAGVKGSMKSRKQGSSQKYTALESKVVEVLDVSRRNKVFISTELVRDCSRKIQDELLSNPQLSEEEAKDLRDFTPTDFWIRSFAKRHNIRIASARLMHIPISLSEAPATPECNALKAQLQRYDADCIFTVYDSALFHKVLPRETYLLSTGGNEGDPLATSFPPDMALDDRVAVVCCANATGTMKVPLAMIGKSKQPSCFRIKPSPLTYLTQSNVWFDIATFKQWFNEVFIPAIRKHSWKNVALLVENVIDENSVQDQRGQVKVFHLPPDSRTSHHPMEQGIMSLLKQRYRYAMLERVMELLPFRDAIQACSLNKTEAFKGLDEGDDPNFLDVAEILVKSWKETSPQSIARSWVKTNILPDEYNSALIARHGKSRAFDNSEMLMESCSVPEKERIQRVNTIIRLRRVGNRQTPSGSAEAPSSWFRNISDAQLEAWLCLEERKEVLQALRNEAQQTVLAIGHSANHGSNGVVQPDAAHGGINGQGQTQFLPSLAAIAELFVPLEELASVSETGDAASHLRQAKRELFASKIREMGPSAMQPLASSSLPASSIPPPLPPSQNRNEGR